MKENILCIDDIKTNLFTLESILESNAEHLYDVFTALSAQEGFDILLKHKIDLILLDVMMPEIDGYEAARIIRSNKKTKNIPIIFVTAKKDDESIEKCYEVGGDDYVNKPFNYIELLARISFHLKSRNKDRLLKQEREYAQSIIDLQENIILVSDGSTALNVNKALLDFYGLRNLSQFQDKHKCVCNTFLKDDGYFSLDLMKDSSQWINEVIKLSKKEDVLVKILKDSVEHIFNVKATVFSNQYIVTLTDITYISKRSLEYKYEASFDNLTQIYNRNMFNRVIEDKITQAKIHKKQFVLVLFDIDHFKNVNDTYGHLVGDEILKELSSLIKSHIRDSDLFARWGGEEFILALDVDIERGLSIAENLRKYVENKEFSEVENMSCSFGITEFRDSDTLDKMVKRADEALYKAKNSGRNKVCQV
jgi:diguanylate cyclase (GGDEF)-like protein